MYRSAVDASLLKSVDLEELAELRRATADIIALDTSTQRVHRLRWDGPTKCTQNLKGLSGYGRLLATHPPLPTPTYLLRFHFCRHAHLSTQVFSLESP